MKRRVLIESVLLGIVIGGTVLPSGVGGAQREEGRLLFPDGPAACPHRGSDLPPALRGEPVAGPSTPVPPPARVWWGDQARDLAFIRWTGVVADPLSEEIPVRIREGTVGLTIRAEEPGAERLVSVELLGPGGELLACETCVDAPAVGEIRPGRGTTQMPSTDRPGWELDPGDYAFRVRVAPVEGATAADSATLTVTAGLRTEAAVQVDWVLDLRFIYLTDSGMTADLARTVPEFDQFLDGVDKWLEPAGIRLGRVTHVDFDRPEFTRIGSWEEAARMFKTSDEVGLPRALNVYCIEAFEGDLRYAAGLAGGIPGAALNGTRDSGVAIRISPFLDCTVLPGERNCLNVFTSLLVHEIGHILGLYHTTEIRGDEEDPIYEDPLSDTPRCETISYRSCPDYRNVMFPFIHSRNILWSPHQILIARTHPLIRTVARVGGAPGTVGDDRVATAWLDRMPGGRTEGPVARPNPFREETRFVWSGGSGVRSGNDRAVGSVYDVRGRRIRALGPGESGLTWDGRDGNGTPVSAGVYFIRIEDGDTVSTLRVLKAR